MIKKYQHLLDHPCRIDMNANKTTTSYFSVDCFIRDVRESWGRIQVQITPQAGEGLIWVDFDRVKLFLLKESARKV